MQARVAVGCQNGWCSGSQWARVIGEQRGNVALAGADWARNGRPVKNEPFALGMEIASSTELPADGFCPKALFQGLLLQTINEGAACLRAAGIPYLSFSS